MGATPLLETGALLPGRGPEVGLGIRAPLGCVGCCSDPMSILWPKEKTLNGFVMRPVISLSIVIGFIKPAIPRNRFPTMLGIAFKSERTDPAGAATLDRLPADAAGRPVTRTEDGVRVQPRILGLVE